jgi:D-glycero-alpha-D-manno-heptose-7-phosphate kinase
MILEAAAPVRIDLAGGTLDLYPLYLFLEGAVTVNAAVSLTCQVRLEPEQDEQIHITSLDGGQTIHSESLQALPLTGDLGFICRAVRFFHHRSGGGLKITTNTIVPRGSGLGTSSSLLVALGLALCRYNNIRMPKEALVARIAELEAQSIGVPTGKQDYYAALHGGVNAIHFQVAENRVERIVQDPAFLKALEKHIILTFSGESHQSAIANWNMLRAFVEDLGDNRARMRQIRQIALQMRQALLEKDIEKAGELLNQEWECRKGLAEGISTPRIEMLVSAAKEAGAWASKVCGAGGGGCIITIAPPERRRQVAEALRKVGARELPFRIPKSGARLRRRD